jgi:hypothetical protein
MKLLSFLFSILFVIPLFSLAQNDSDWESKTYFIHDFTQRHIEGGYKVYLSQGDKCGLTVKATGSDVFDVLQVKQFGDELNLDIERDNFDFDRINLYITFKKLEKIEIEGGVTMRTKGYLDLKDFLLHVEGGAKINLDLKADDVKIIGEGGVLFELKGVAESLDVKISGAGNVDADQLKAKDVTFYIEGVGTGSVYATKTLDAKIEGVGKLKYKGDPKVTQYIDGLGSVKRD